MQFRTEPRTLVNDGTFEASERTLLAKHDLSPFEGEYALPSHESAPGPDRAQRVRISHDGVLPPGTSPEHASLLALQRTAGNQAVTGLVQTRSDQASSATSPQWSLAQRDGPPAPAPAPAGMSIGQQALAAIRAQPPNWTTALQLLNGQDMASLLAALDELRGATSLDLVATHIDNTPGILRARIWAALLAAQLHLGSRFRDFGLTLPEDQRLVVTRYCLGRMDSGAVPEAMRRTSDGTVFSSGPVTDDAWAEAFLRFFGLAPTFPADPTGQAAVFNGVTTTLTDTADMVIGQASLVGRALQHDVASRATSQVYAAGLALRHPAAVQDDGRGIHWSLTYSFAPTTGHVDLATPHDTSADQPGHQVGGQLIYQFHRDDRPGWELSAVANVTFFADESGQKIRLQNVVAGGQAAWVVPFAKGWLQASVFMQAVGGAAFRQHNLDGVQRVTMDKSAQVGAGGQLLVFVPGTDRHVMLGAQLGASVTGATSPSDSRGRVRDQPSATGDIGGNVFLQVQF